MDEMHSTAAVQDYLDELGGVKNDSLGRFRWPTWKAVASRDTRMTAYLSFVFENAALAAS